jgi:hypothetical protein
MLVSIKVSRWLRLAQGPAAAEPETVNPEPQVLIKCEKVMTNAGVKTFKVNPEL